MYIACEQKYFAQVMYVKNCKSCSLCVFEL